MVNEKIKNIISSLPAQPGVYQFYDDKEKIIYVGKAKNLKKRVASYFSKIHDAGKTNVLVSKIVNIEHIVVDTEMDALLLENNLIKKYQPRYNMRLKDDKTFPWICIKNEPFPRVFFTRNVVKDGSQYFGPFTSLKTVRTLLDLAKKLYPLRTCGLNLSSDNITNFKYKVCLEYHIGNCKGPCEGYQTSEEYLENINKIKLILQGNISDVIKNLKQMMFDYSNNLRFEDAHLVKEKLEILENFQSKSTIVSTSIHNVDVFTVLDDKDRAYVNYLKIINGAITQVHSTEVVKVLDEDIKEILLYAIIDIREQLHSYSKEIIIPFPLDYPISGCFYTIPQIGDKKKLIDLSLRNAMYYRNDSLLKKSDFSKKIDKTSELMETMKKELSLSELPLHIECFDNSNIQGTNPVAACVVFKKGKPSPKDYRHFHIKTVEGPDDFASMEEIVHRRYSRLLDENLPLPNLIVVDGGKGQLSSAYKVLQELGIHNKLQIIGIAKKLEEIYKPEDSIPIYIPKNSQTLKVIQHIRNEAHRFGITFHRDVRSKNFIHSELDNIKGIGEKTKMKIFEAYKTIEILKLKSKTELEQTLGVKIGNLLFNHFHNTPLS